MAQQGTVAPYAPALRVRLQFFFSAIRPRLALLIFVTTGPLIGLLVLAGVESRNDAVAGASRQAEQLAQIASERQDDVIQEALLMLTVLARVP